MTNFSASISLLKDSSGSSLWYMASISLNGQKSLGFGTSHYKALIDAINSAIKSKY